MVLQSLKPDGGFFHLSFTTHINHVQQQNASALKRGVRVWRCRLWSGIISDMPSESSREILDKLLERRREIAREAHGLDALIDVYEALLSQPRSESVDGNQLSLYAQPTSRAMRSAETARTIDAARREILAANRPLKRGELVDVLERKGFSFHGADRVKVFGTNLWRSGKFRTIGDEGYWPRDTPLPRRM